MRYIIHRKVLQSRAALKAMVKLYSAKSGRKCTVLDDAHRFYLVLEPRNEQQGRCHERVAPLSLLLCIRPLLGIDVLSLLYIRLPTTKPTTLPNFEKKTNNLILLATAVSLEMVYVCMYPIEVWVETRWDPSPQKAYKKLSRSDGGRAQIEC